MKINPNSQAKCLLALMTSLVSCLPMAEAKPQNFSNSKKTEEKIQMAQAPTHAVTTPSGLKYSDEVMGNGPSPHSGQTVVVHYTGWLVDGQKFDSSVDRGTPFEFVLGQGQVIRGWDEGVASMKVGGTRKLVIPPTLAYGERGIGGVIPPNSTLVFQVQLLGIK